MVTMTNTRQEQTMVEEFEGIAERMGQCGLIADLEREGVVVDDGGAWDQAARTYTGTYGNGRGSVRVIFGWYADSRPIVELG